MKRRVEHNYRIEMYKPMELRGWCPWSDYFTTRREARRVLREARKHIDAKFCLRHTKITIETEIID